MNDDKTMKDILLSAKTIASVGVSSNKEKESYWIVSYLKEQGYQMIPVNPTTTEILGHFRCGENGTPPVKRRRTVWYDGLGFLSASTRPKPHSSISMPSWKNGSVHPKITAPAQPWSKISSSCHSMKCA